MNEVAVKYKGLERKKRQRMDEVMKKEVAEETNELTFICRYDTLSNY